jgi:hypothetical protein
VSLRFGPRFPGALPARASATLEHLHFASRALVASCRMGQTEQSQPSGPAVEIPSAGSFCGNSASRISFTTADRLCNGPEYRFAENKGDLAIRS